MRIVYRLDHKRVVESISETGEKVHDTKLLGFFSSEKKCKEAIRFYSGQPGFKDYLNDFVIEEIEADIDDFNDAVGEFDKDVFYLAHEYYDGEYDYVTDLGYYSTRQMAEKGLLQYKDTQEFAAYTEGFSIDKYEIDITHWTDGF